VDGASTLTINVLLSRRWQVDRFSVILMMFMLVCQQARRLGSCLEYVYP
jgi:hypothetical protein